MLYTDYCSKCKVRDTPLIKYSRTQKKQYHLCRPCANQKMKDYAGTKRGKEARQRNQVKTRAKYEDKYKARVQVNRAVAGGILAKPQSCTVCLSEGRIEAHHPNYNEPLTVVWLCVNCHAKVHS